MPWRVLCVHAPLTQERQFRDEQALVRRPVRVVARRAVLAHRRVLPQERPALLLVTARTGFVDAVAHTQQADVLRTVHIVAGRALQLAFAHRHVSHAIEFRELVAVALPADLELVLRLQAP
jgi:hypothetical protein